jgi:hypothetical protein
MPTTSPEASVAAHFADRDPVVERIYERLLAQAKKFGPVSEEPKKTSIHLVRSTAFAGVATQKKAVILTLRLTHDVRSKRVRRHEQASANRWHLELKLDQPSDVDAELAGWLREAYDLAATKGAAASAP